MAFSKKALVASFVLLSFLLFLHITEARLPSNNIGSDRAAQRSLLGSVDCGGACAARCQLSSRPNLCHRACGTCCARCNCVPSGTSGNQEMCGPCWVNMTTHGGRRKCP